MAPNAGTRLEDIDSRVHIADANDLIHIHIIMPTDFCQLICKSNIHGTEGIFHHFGHFRRANIRHHDLAPAEGGVHLLDPLPHFPAVCADGTVVVEQFIDHVAGNDPLRRMHEMDILPDHKALFLHGRADILIHGAGRDGGFHHHRCAFPADFQNVLHCGNHITGVYLLAELIIGRRHGNDVSIRGLVRCGEGNAPRYGFAKQLLQSLFLKSGVACLQSGHQFRIIVRAHDCHPVGCQHQCRRQADIPKSDHIYHVSHPLPISSR